LNAGLTFLPDAGPAPRADLLHYNVGASVIYAMTSDLNLMLECISVWEDTREAHELVTLLSPGLRRAFNFSNGSQLVLGIAVPIGLTHAAPDLGAFVYASFEHSLIANKD
jgi:hypothetical protein